MMLAEVMIGKGLRPTHSNQIYEERYRTDLGLVPHILALSAAPACSMDRERAENHHSCRGASAGNRP